MHLADGREERPQKNDPRSCDSSLLLLIESQFFMLCYAVYFVLIA